MSYKSAIDIYHNDLANLLKMLDVYVINYRNLVSTLNDINLNVLISKRKKRRAIKQVEELGCIIDVLLESICKVQQCYLRYVKMKCDVLCEIINWDFIKLEIEQELLLNLDTDFKHKFLSIYSPKGNSSIIDLK
ncbi:hypothetical protein [Candidatus Arthromitus sp. SFB-rat-Yit]|uniref:hypothetical protein n=1 Tax=Candidatus Arthromitus sp. SFB-rat-Yit TaxID=1041504 RepID=UPI000227A6EF|nr:hypothetical protein [Candidatus Arthromitus sp. SFB-rat-Yit]BAK81701.1 hypothetical protein RATSFB_1139 [Candidatus Arthromitus sp. SFB-rat-Yit]